MNPTDRSQTVRTSDPRSLWPIGMSKQENTVPYTENGAGWKAQETSRMAAQRTKPETTRAAILTLMRLHKRPISCDEIARRMGREITSIRPRITELTKMGKVENSGQRGRTEAGRSCILWQIKGEV